MRSGGVRWEPEIGGEDKKTCGTPSRNNGHERKKKHAGNEGTGKEAENRKGDEWRSHFHFDSIRRFVDTRKGRTHRRLRLIPRVSSSSLTSEPYSALPELSKGVSTLEGGDGNVLYVEKA